MERGWNKFSISSISMVAVSLLLIAFSVIGDDQDLRSRIHWIYLIQLIAFSILAYRYHGGLPALIRPSAIGMAYMSISFSLGSAAFYYNQIIGLDTVNAYWGWTELKTSAVFMLSSMCLMALATFIVKVGLVNNEGAVYRKGKTQPSLYRMALIGGLLAVLALDFPFSAIFRITIAVVLLHSVYAAREKYRWAYVLGVIFLLAVASTDSKRNAIFLILPVVWLEWRYFQSARIRFRTVLLASAGGLALFYLIVAMSIMRGYGVFDPDSFVDAFRYIPQYMQDPLAWGFLANNFEISSVFFNSHNAIEMVSKRPELLAYGESIFKVLFLGVPEGIFDYKPRSILDLYTREWDSGFREVGGSYPITFASEMFWNFSWAGLLGVFIVSYLTEKFYKNLVLASHSRQIVKVNFLLVIYLLNLMLIRGSGLDIFLAYVLISMLILWLLIKPLQSFSRTRIE